MIERSRRHSKSRGGAHGATEETVLASTNRALPERWPWPASDFFSTSPRPDLTALGLAVHAPQHRDHTRTMTKSSHPAMPRVWVSSAQCSRNGLDGKPQRVRAEGFFDSSSAAAASPAAGEDFAQPLRMVDPGRVQETSPQLLHASSDRGHCFCARNRADPRRSNRRVGFPRFDY